MENAFLALKRRINKAAEAAGRRVGSVTLTAVVKTQPWEKVEAALAAGVRDVGENRVQEAKARWADRRQAWPDLTLRLIGPLQTNKAEEAVALFDIIETLDRDRLAAALSAAMARTGRRPQIFVQVNTGEEPQKAGLAPQAVADFLVRARETHGLTVSGLMCIPPADEEPAMHFALLAKLAARHGLKQLSMGMSADFETAIGLGATSVRLGAALFGPR